MDNFSQYFKKSFNINTAFMGGNANNSPDALVSFMNKNIIWFVVAVIVGISIFFIVYLVKERHNKGGPKKIKADYSIYRVDDELKHEAINNNEIECPKALNKYSFVFFVELQEFYCDTGYWKALMIKGDELNRSTVKCGSYRNEEEIKLEKCFENYDGKIDQDLKQYIENNKESIDIKRDLSKRLHLICKAHKLDLDKQEGTKQLCHAASKCRLFKSEDDFERMSEGQCVKFVNEHKDYCDMVYKLEDKVARDSNPAFGNKKDSYYDEYDNICSEDTLLDKYPELLPRNLDSLKEIKLISLAEKMDVINGENKEDKTLEGCYDFTYINKLIANDIADNKITEDFKIKLSEKNILAECNRYSLGKSNYFGINNGNCYTIPLSKEEDIDINSKKSNLKCINENTEINKTSKGSRIPNQDNKIFISKALRPEENILLTCWEDIINTYPTQNPGVWLHPYINDLRIVVTTVSNDPQSKYDEYINEMIHPFKNTNLRNLRNYIISPLTNDEMKQITNHAFYSPSVSSNKCQKGMKTTNNITYYREYFDVKNIPIKEKFNLAIVINERLVEVYINGDLHTSQVLFGEPNYNSGPLHISPGLNEKEGNLNLNGIITDFKYYNKAINFQNIRNIIKEKSVIQSDDNVILQKEHTHSVGIEHDHHMDVIKDTDHKHGLSDKNIDKDYYLED